MKKYIIIAPHADDEIIGCYELLAKGLVEKVLFFTSKDCEEAIPSSEHFEFSIGLVEEHDFPIVSNMIYLFPDPTTETHPLHRYLGNLGEEYLRRGEPVIFYTTNMLAPYLHEVSQAMLKAKCLDKLYPNKRSLWEYDHKYFLFEGYTQWMMQWRD